MALTRARVLRAEIAEGRESAGRPSVAASVGSRRAAVLPAPVVAAYAEAERVLDAARASAAALERAAHVRAEASLALAAAEAREAEVARLAAIALHLDARQAATSARALDRAVELGKLLAERLVGAQLSLEPERIAGVFAELLAEARGASTARVLGRAEDLGALQQTLDALGFPAGAIVLVADPTLTRGSLVLESDLGTVDGRLEIRLERLAGALVGALRAHEPPSEPR